MRFLHEALRALKARARRRARERRERERVHVVVRARDALWSVDATHLARDARGGAMLGRVVRDVATTATPAIAVGPPARAEEIVVQLERASASRGGAPLVLASDNGPEYVGGALEQWCRAMKVVHLRNLPHTPQHNPWVEHANGELKELAAELVGPWSARLRDAAHLLDHHRLRASRGYRTAAALDAISPRGDHLVDRDAFYEAACSAVSRALEGLESSRVRRRAEREAIFATMQCFGLITRTRGGVPIPAREPESVS